MHIAKNLKRLRLGMGWTQEALAARIGVTGQAVSKWERGACYPDITLLPGLANCLGVTVDALLGMAEIKGGLGDAYARASALLAQGAYHDAAAVYDEALEAFPADPGLLAARAEALAMTGTGISDAIEACLRLLVEDISDKRRASAVAVLCFLYHANGMTPKAVQLARTRPHARESRELLLPNFLSQPEREAYLREQLPQLLADICRLIGEDVDACEGRIRQISTGVYQGQLDPFEALEKLSAFLR